MNIVYEVQQNRSNTHANYHRKTKQNKHCSEILQETLLNRVSSELPPFIVGQSHDSFTLLSAKNAMLFQHLQQAIQVLCPEYRQETL
jgi:hypothetical protein